MLVMVLPSPILERERQTYRDSSNFKLTSQKKDNEDHI